MTRGSLRVAMIGTRGVPATFGGIEHHVEEIGARLAARGHQVTVYCRSNYVDRGRREHRGMKLRRLPTVSTKSFDALVHSALATADALGRRYDVIHYHALGPGLVAPAARFGSRACVVQTIHGLDDQRAKWNATARTALRVAGWMSARVPDATVVVSNDLVRHYAERHGTTVTCIPNGATTEARLPAQEIRDAWGLGGQPYVLFLGRFVPEKCPDLLLRAFRRVETDHRLVLAGGSSFTDAYVEELQALARQDTRVLLPGYVYGRRRQELSSNASLFVLPSTLEGLPLTLLDAVAHGVPVVASAIAPHVEVLQEDQPGGRLVPPGDEAALTKAIQAALGDLEAERRGVAGFRPRVVATYDWGRAAEATEQVYYETIARRRRSAPQAVDGR